MRTSYQKPCTYVYIIESEGVLATSLTAPGSGDKFPGIIKKGMGASPIWFETSGSYFYEDESSRVMSKRTDFEDDF